MNKTFIFKSLFMLSSGILAVGALAAFLLSLWSEYQALATMDPQISGMVLLLIIPGNLWTLALLVAGVLGLLSLKWQKLRSAGMVLGLLYGVRTGVSLIECFIYSNYTHLVSILGMLILILAFVVSAIQLSPDPQK